MDEEGLNVWPSFADVTSTIALVLFVLVLLAYIRNLVAGKQLMAYENQIAISAGRLSALRNRLDRTREEIALGQARLRLSEERLEQQKRIVAESGRELGTLRARLQGIALLRVDVLNKVKDSIEEQLHDIGTGAPVVLIGDNGNIVLNEALVFEYNSYEIKEAGTKLLDTLATAMLRVLRDPSVRENIDTIVVQGHTDDRGSPKFNRELSAKRASAVLGHLFEAEPELEKRYGSYFAASAFSEFRPIDPAQSEEARSRNRRIEVAVVLKDSNVRRVIEEYTSTIQSSLDDLSGAAGTDPGTAPAADPASSPRPEAINPGRLPSGEQEAAETPPR